MRSVSSAFWLALQADKVNLGELITLTTRTRTFRWSSSNVSIVASGQIYDPFPGNNVKGVEESTDLGVTNTNFTLANTGALLRQLLESSDVDMADVLVERIFVETPDLGRMEIFRGKVSDYTFDRDQISGGVRGYQQGANQQWPYYTYQDNCVWRFGGTGCGKNTSSLSVAGSLSLAGSDRQTLLCTSGTLVLSYAPGSLEFGRVTMTSGANSGQLRTVFSNTGDQLILSHTLPFSLDLLSGVTFSVFPGCRKRLVEDCTSRYNNNSAFLGVPWTPRLEDVF